MVLSDSAEGKPMAKAAKRRCRRGLMTKEPAVGFIAEKYCVFISTFSVSLFKS